VKNQPSGLSPQIAQMNADIFWCGRITKAKRSEVMLRIRGRGDKKTESALAQLLRKNTISNRLREKLVESGTDAPSAFAKATVGQGGAFPPGFGFLFCGGQGIA
jgi:hypothetical protein